jgi:hypothetical protein
MRPPGSTAGRGRAADVPTVGFATVWELLQAVVLGIIQGLTEFLPISSSAHLRIFPEMLG